jgi:hypothetical protein
MHSDTGQSRYLQPAELPELTPRGRVRFERRLSLVRLVESGASIRDALRLSKLNVTERTAVRLLRHFNRIGPSALVDRRLLSQVDGRNPRRARTPALEAIVLRLWKETRSGTAGLCDEVSRACQREGVPVPSRSTIRRIVAALREAHADRTAAAG